jgi:hypothetical protein
MDNPGGIDLRAKIGELSESDWTATLPERLLDMANGLAERLFERSEMRESEREALRARVAEAMDLAGPDFKNLLDATVTQAVERFVQDHPEATTAIRE